MSSPRRATIDSPGVKRFAAEWAQDINLRLLEEEEVDLNL
ncbi:hypothetical protein GCM10029978_022600 [Actinoallomurus acanthiterrae]